MSWIVDRIKWIMIVSGALTCTMIYAAFAPEAALHSTFGRTLEGPVAEIVVRNWGALITLVGRDADLWSLQAGEQAIDCERGRTEQTGLHRPGDRAG